MARFDDELQEAIDTLDIEAWLDREGVRYRHTHGSRGPQLNVKECPVCGNSNYKVYIGAETGLGNCFSGDCETKFNKYKFIAASLGLPHRAVIEHIKAVAKEFGWRPPRKKSMAVKLTSKDLKLPESFALPYQGRNVKYLDNRNISGDVAQYFELRYSMRGTFDYINDAGRPMSQDYSHRIIIPIFDLEGELVSFQGRDTTGTADQKYLFPPGFASTGAYLYNGYNAVGAEHIVIGEGVFDVAAIKIALDADVSLRDVVPVGSFGKHLSHDNDDSQVAKVMQLKEQGLKIVTLMWDGEPAAIAAAVKSALMLKSLGLITRVAVLPAGKDPNEVAGAVVRQAFYSAELATPAMATKLLLSMR